MTGTPRDPWAQLGRWTPARIALGRVGASLPTCEVLSFALAHARARDAVQARLDREALAGRLEVLGLASVEANSMASDRVTYLRRPDLGRRLDDASRDRLDAYRDEDCDLVVLIGDGLSATAVAGNADSLMSALLPYLSKAELKLGPVVIAQNARVALGDDVGALIGARLIAVLIGERPGLSAADSMSVYLTYAPRPGRTDAERNCISNIRANGLTPEAAASNLAWLISAAIEMKLTGVNLKDRSVAGRSKSDHLVG
ncbi:MAG: ethanolamine ammonia-lyase subunit EutC [Hyphomicrobiaceae bacterium]|nr:ethanolamine ammonia-lyase subunit EutC [Hyphomicrobiaceae bacterium]